MSSYQQMAQDLRNLGVRENGVLLVHTSLRALGKIEGGAETVIKTLLDVLGSEGTLLMPALSYRDVGRHSPIFDVRTIPACIGALPEYFRQREGTIRSIHPTHSVCGIGKQAQSLLGTHQHDKTPCGENSPFHKLPKYDGQILFIGCGMRPNTSMHAIEELSEPPYLYGDIVEYDIVNADSTKSKMTVLSHNFLGWEQRYERLADLLDNFALKMGKVLEADCYLVEASAMWEVAHAQYLADPLFFVERES